ncbi:MAG TPA: thioesterase family protein [Acidimicrobiia bacterium]|nr:thioesterase family protein [Acidimicrobiia bacterium]
MGHLDAALELVPDGQRWRAHADADHESISAMFGGWTAAIMLGAVAATAASDARPSALTANFIRPVPPGRDVVIIPSRLGGGRSLEHWRADLRAIDSDETDSSELLATALVVLTNRRDSEPHAQFAMPTVPGPEGLEQFHAPGPQGQQTEIREVSGEWGSGDTRGCLWVRDAAGRSLDHLQLAYLADQYAPRSFYWGVGTRPSATITLSIYFHATADELAAVDTDYILNEATGTRGEQSTSGQQARLWSRDGVLLATTEQLCWYR